MATFIDENYVKARAGLLDALGALGPLRRAAILVGAQAVYVHTHDYDADFAVQPFTYDAGLALNPKLLVSEPKIIEAMQTAGFNLTEQPGIYKRDDGGQVDLLVPQAVGGPGNRGARLGIHGNRAARKVHGLEGALVSHIRKEIESLGSGDPRAFAIEVAGPAALLVAKVHKIAERIDDPNRGQSLNKDAFDIYRLLLAVDVQELASEVRRLMEHEVSGEVTATALALFRDLFDSLSAKGTEQVVRHVAGLEDPDSIAASSVSLSRDLLDLTSQWTDN